MVGGGGDGLGIRGREERVPQWSPQETRDLIAIRGGLERDIAASKRNKTLWEAVAARMQERGHLRTSEQCKCKWKNLVNRYKGKETSGPENGKQCPFFNELHAVFTERARNMHRQLLEPESGSSYIKRKTKRSDGDRSSEELSDDGLEDEEYSGDERPTTSRKRKADRVQQQQQRGSERPSRVTVSSIHDVLQGFLQQQRRMDDQWQEMMERRAQERLMLEQEWRQSMEKLERERLMLEQAWMQREEERRIREETRAEKRDQLLTSLLNKLLQDDL